jgi:predicted permease
MILVNTVGIYIAARSRFSVRNAALSVLKLPSFYALLLAVILKLLDLQIPAGIGQGVDMVAQAYSPVVLTILGAQMASVKIDRSERISQRTFWAGLGMRMIAAPLVAALCLLVLGIDGVLFSVLFILASMPVAVNAVILAERFDASAKIVSKCILWTTLLSFVTLPLLIVLVK